jgi:hypothetical protein
MEQENVDENTPIVNNQGWYLNAKNQRFSQFCNKFFIHFQDRLTCFQAKSHFGSDKRSNFNAAFVPE